MSKRHSEKFKQEAVAYVLRFPRLLEDEKPGEPHYDDRTDVALQNRTDHELSTRGDNYLDARRHIR